VSASVPQPRPRRRRRAPRRRPSRLQAIPKVVRAIVGTVGFVATVLGLAFVLWPSLKPDPPPADKGATISNAQVEPGMTFGAYLDRIEQSRKPYTRPVLDEQGAFVEFDFAVRGYKDKRLPLGWQLLDARTGVQLAQSRALRVTSHADRDAGVWNVWIPLRRTARRMYAQIALYNAAGVPIGRVRTPAFSAAPQA
jgi:hypothetical protein